MSKSNPVRLWRFGHTRALKIQSNLTKGSSWGCRKRCFFLLEMEGQDQLLRHAQVMISHRKSKKVINVAWFGHTSLPPVKKKRTKNGRFPCPAETDPCVKHQFWTLFVIFLQKLCGARPLPERDICVVDAGNHCLPRTSHSISCQLVTSPNLLAATAGSHRSLTQMPPKPPETNEKISPNTVQKCPSRKYLGQNCANIFCSVWNLWSERNAKDWTTVKLGSDWAKCYRSSFVFPILLHKCVVTIGKFATSLSPPFCRNMTHLSAGLRFVGTHLSIETSVSVPPSSPTHHWSMVSPGKETVDLTRLQVRSPPAPVGQSGCSGGGEWGAFSGRCPLLRSPLPGAACASSSDHQPAYTSSLLCCCCSGIWVESSRAAAAAVSPPVQPESCQLSAAHRVPPRAPYALSRGSKWSHTERTEQQQRPRKKCTKMRRGF